MTAPAPAAIVGSRSMAWLDTLGLFALAVIVNAAASHFISQPGYTDAYYYFGGARQLAAGHGFSEPYLWNYLAPVPALAAGQALWPSHLYWMPLVSMVAAPFMAAATRIAGSGISAAALFRAAQIPMLLAACVLPVLSYGVARLVGVGRRQGLTAGLLTLFSPFYFIYWTTTDAFALYALTAAGALVLAALAARRPAAAGRWLFAAGFAAGLAHLTRADGVLVALCLVCWLLVGRGVEVGWRARLRLAAALLAGYALVMLPWFARNWEVAGAPLGPGGLRTVWLIHYDDLFTLAPARLTARAYFASGLANILAGKWSALLANLQTLVAAQGSIFALPFALIGLWRLRQDVLMRLAVLYEAALLAAMTLVFTFPGARGGYLHSGAALLPFFLVSAVVGLEASVEAVARRLRHWQPERSKPIFAGLLVVLALGLTAFVFWRRAVGPDPNRPAWASSEQVYGQAGAWLAAQGEAEAVTAVNDPPGWNFWTGAPAIVIPNGDAATLRQAMTTYGVHFVVLDSNHPVALGGLYADPHSQPQFQLLASFADSGGQPVYLLELAPGS